MNIQKIPGGDEVPVPDISSSFCIFSLYSVALVSVVIIGVFLGVPWIKEAGDLTCHTGCLAF